MYAPTQGPVNTGFAQTVIEAKATGSDLKRGQLVSIGFNADGAPSATLTTFQNDAGRPTPVGLLIAPALLAAFHVARRF